MKLIKDVLIKLSRGGFSDRVLYIDNIPEDLFYEMKHPKKCIGEGNKQRFVPDTDQPKVPTLYEELTLSQTGDKGIVFDLENGNAGDRYRTVDRYMKLNYPNNKILAEPKHYASDPSAPASPPLALSEVPRVVLPVLSPAGSPVSDSTTPTLIKSLDVDVIRKQAVAEYQAEQKAIVKERMAKARSNRKK